MSYIVDNLPPEAAIPIMVIAWGIFLSLVIRDRRRAKKAEASTPHSITTPTRREQA